MPDLEPETVEKGSRAPIRLIDEVVTETTRLLAADGEMSSGKGLRTTALALGSGISWLPGCPGLSFSTIFDHARIAARIFRCSFAAISCLPASWFRDACRWAISSWIACGGPNITAFLFVLAAVALGGSKVPVGAFPDHTPYLGLDWLILDLLGSTTVFVLLEKLFPLNRTQVVFRKEWQTDLTHFGVNHLLVGLLLLVVNFFIHRLLAWVGPAPFQQRGEHIPYLPQVLLCVLVADLMEYTTHRAYHEVPWLWKFHAVHHSVKTLDWLAGSRPALAGNNGDARGGAGTFVLARLREKRHRYLHQYRWLSGGVYPRQYPHVVGAAQIFDRDAQLPSLAPLLGRGSHRTAITRHTLLFWIICSEQRSRRPANFRKSTAWLAITCPKAI